MIDLQPYDGPSHGAGKLSWLGSREGVATARTGTLSGFTGEVKAGTPVSEGDGVYVAYDAGDGDENAGNALTGFVLSDVTVRSGRDAVVAILDRGRIRTDRLPVEFTAPAESGRFTFVSDS